MTRNQFFTAGLRIHHREDPKLYRDRHQISSRFFADLQSGGVALREAAQNAIDAVDGIEIPQAIPVDLRSTRLP